MFFCSMIQLQLQNTSDINDITGITFWTTHNQRIKHRGADSADRQVLIKISEDVAGFLLSDTRWIVARRLIKEDRESAADEGTHCRTDIQKWRV